MYGFRPDNARLLA